MSLVDNIRNDLADYAGLVPVTATELDVAMQRIVSENGTDALLDEGRLHRLMGECGVGEIDICKVLLLSKVDGFRELVTRDGYCPRVDLDRFVANAERQAGLNRYEIGRITRAISDAVGVTYDYKAVPAGGDPMVRERAFTIPASLYDKELVNFGNDLGKAVANGSSLLDQDFGPIEPLVEMGIPLAKHYMGYCLLHGSDDASTQDTGIALLTEAAAAGNSQAMAELGDYYYDQGTSSWTQAFDCYTGIGALALSPKRHENVLAILNRKSTNSKMLVSSAVMLALMLLTSVFGLGASVLPGILLTLVSAVILVFGFLHFRKAPYDDVYVFPVAMFVLWTISVALSSLF